MEKQQQRRQLAVIKYFVKIVFILASLIILLLLGAGITKLVRAEGAQVRDIIFDIIAEAVVALLIVAAFVLILRKCLRYFAKAYDEGIFDGKIEPSIDYLAEEPDPILGKGAKTEGTSSESDDTKPHD
jgi:hypothetical protein